MRWRLGSPKCTKCGASVPTALLAKSIWKRKERSELELWDSSLSMTLIEMNLKSPSLAKFISTVVLNFWLSLIFSETVDCHLLRTYKFPLCPLDRVTLIHPIKTGNLSQGDLAEMYQLPGVATSLTVRLTCLGFWRTRALLRTASVMTFVVWGLARLCGYDPQVTTLLSIQGSILVVIIGRVWLLNNFCYKSPLLVSVTFLFFLSLVWVAIFGLLAGSTFVSFMFNESDSYNPALLIVNPFNVSTSTSDLSSFSLVNIVFKFSLYVLGVWLKVLTVPFWASGFMLWEYSSSSAMNICITTRIFSLENGAPLRSFQYVMVLKNYT